MVASCQKAVRGSVIVVDDKKFDAERWATWATRWRGAVQNTIVKGLKWLVTRAGMPVRIVGVRAVPGELFTNKGMAG